MESIKAHRKSPAYRKTLANLRLLSRMEEIPQQPEPVGETGLPTNADWTESDTAVYEGLILAVEQHRSTLKLSDEKFETLLNQARVELLGQEGTPTFEGGEARNISLQSLIDTEYDEWVREAFPGYRSQGGNRERGPHQGTHSRGSRYRQGRAQHPRHSGQHTDNGEDRTHNSSRPRRSHRAIERTARYREVQRMYAASKGRCAEYVLSGKWEQPSQRPTPLSELEEFWGELTETPSYPDSRQWERKGPVLHGPCAPLSLDEVRTALAGMDDTAAGLDKIDRGALRIVNHDALMEHFDLWLMLGTSPSAFRKGYTALGEKSGPVTPANHRPITVSTKIARLLNRVLASRLVGGLPLSPDKKRLFVVMALQITFGCCDQ